MLKHGVFAIGFLVIACLAEEPQDIPDNFVLTKLNETMESPSKLCDDANTSIGVDLDGPAANYTCDEATFVVNQNIAGNESCNAIVPKKNPHICMDTRIDYLEKIPAFGAHRPKWATYGEYKFLPPQRWIHSLEHGAIVMLYHPCADPKEVENLNKILTSCVRRHIITPYKLLDAEMPLALVSWGCRYEMSFVDEVKVKDFITRRFGKAPEPKAASEGAYNYQLVRKAEIVSDIKDSNVCPSKL